MKKFQKKIIGILFSLVIIAILAIFLAFENAKNSVIVLNYHQINDKDKNALTVTVKDFEDQMQYLSENGFTTITPKEMTEAFKNNEKLPQKSVIIAFDDGYQDNYDNAYPILKKYGFSATVFVITGFVGKSGYLTWDEIREMQEGGVTFASHTVSHKSMTDLTDNELKKELVDSKAKLEEELKSHVEFMAYPTGTYNLHIAQIVKDAGYKAAFTIKYGNVDKASNIYALERVPIFHTEETNKDFIERIRYQPIFESFGWMKN